MAASAVPDSVRNRGVNLEEPAELGDNLHELQPRHGRDMGIAEVAGFGDYGGGCGCGGYERAVLLGTEENRADGTQRRRGEVNGEKVMRNMVDINTNEDQAYIAARAALRELQNAMEGEAERAGLYTEDDVVALVKEVRAELAAERLLNTKGESQT